MAWLSAGELRSKFSIQANKYESQLGAAITDAALVIQRGVTSDIYAEAIAADPPDAEPELLRYSSVIQAHSYLAMWFLIGNVGHKLGDTGFIKESQDSASPAVGARIITNRYLTPEELKGWRDSLLASARFNLGDYGVITVEVSEPVTEQQQLGIASLQWF
jgi:hypothetical protein